MRSPTAQVVFGLISLIMMFHFKNIGIDHSYWVFNQNGCNNPWMQWYRINYPAHCFSPVPSITFYQINI